jgi:hypothetical protein
VKKKLVDLAAGHQDFGSSKVDCAECLLEAGHINEGIEALLLIADDPDAYGPDRVRAAELLFKNGHKGIACSVLNDVALGGDELWARAEAACILFEMTPTDENRKLLIEQLNVPADDVERVAEETFERVLALGEKDIALPALRERAKPSAGTQLDREVPWSQIRASKSIARHHNRVEGVASLETLLSAQHTSLRGKAEVLEALFEIGAEEVARRHLKLLVSEPSWYEGADWFVLEMLIDNKLLQEARTVRKYLVRVGIEGARAGVDLIDIIDKLLAIFEREELASTIREKARTAKKSALAVCIAKLGFREEAINLLRTWLTDPDIDLQIRAASALCTLGERKEGLRALNRTVRAKRLAPKFRWDAALALEQAGEHRAADAAHALFLRDRSLSIEDRCRAARYFDDESVGPSEIIWKVLAPIVHDDSASIHDRVVAAKELVQSTEDPTGEFDPTDIMDELFTILKTEILSPTESLDVASALARAGMKFSEVPKIDTLIDNNSISLAARISVLKYFSVRDRDSDAAERLLGIAKDANTPYSQVIDALSSAGMDRVRELRASLVNETTAPPKWRLKAAQSLSIRYGSNDYQNSLLVLVHDESISIRVRLLALRDLPKSFSNEGKVTLIDKMATAPALGNWERISLAQAAIDIGATKSAKALLGNALADEPLSIAEVCDIAKSLQSIGETNRAATLLDALVSLPKIILENTEDHSPTVEAAKQLAQLGESSKAVNFLTQLISVANSWNTVEILEGIEEIGGEDASKHAASNLVSGLMSAPDEPSQDYMGYWHRVFEKLLSKGWVSDLRPLLAVAKDNSKLVGDRAEAAVTIYRYSWRDKSKDWGRIARATLTELSASNELSSHDLIELMPVLREVGLHDRVDQIKSNLLGTDQLKPADRRSLANVLSKMGDSNGALNTLKAISKEEEGSSFLGPWDEKLIADLQGDEHLAEILATRAFNEKEPLMDRLFEARDLVAKFGDKRALGLIHQTAYDAHADVSDRLQATEVLDELEYRGLSRQIFHQVMDDPRADDWWVGDLLLRFGDKAKALRRFRRAITTCSENYRDQIARSLADLNAVGALQELDNASRA